MAAAELAVANRQLAEAGRTIEELRADAFALAKRVDEARAEAEGFRTQLETARAESEARAAAATTELDRMRATIQPLEAHIARLKRQVKSPGKLLVKKALRRGQFEPDA